uniref:Uncharacterized protein n=1 Tax=Globodera rostochiensis TaxID=31243 RepID=A0A914H3D1_GLORO
MASLTLRMALFFAFAAFLVVQCSSDSSESSSDTSDESFNGWGLWGPRHGGNGWGPADFPRYDNTGVAPAPFVPTPSNSTFQTIVELLSNGQLGRKKRSPHGHSNGWGHRRGGNGWGPADFPRYDNTGVAPAPFVPTPSNSTLPTLLELLYPGFIGRKKRSPHGHSNGWGHRRGGNGWGPRRGGNGWGPADFPRYDNTGVAPAPFVPTPSNSTFQTIVELLSNGQLGRKKRSPSSESSSDTSGESSNGVPTELKQLVIPVSARLTVSAASADAFGTSNKSSADNEEEDSQGTGGEMQVIRQGVAVQMPIGRPFN